MCRSFLEDRYCINADSAVHNLTTCEPLHIGNDHFEEANLRANSHLDLKTRTLSIRYTRGHSENTISSQQIGLEARLCRFGGHRWYWRCPRCNKPRMNLYLCEYKAGFYCRECLNLSYASQANSYHRPNGTRWITPLRYCLAREVMWENRDIRRYNYRKSRRERVTYRPLR